MKRMQVDERHAPFLILSSSFRIGTPLDQGLVRDCLIMLLIGDKTIHPPRFVVGLYTSLVGDLSG